MFCMVLVVSGYFDGDTRSNRERMLAGDLYIADDPESLRLSRRAAGLAEAYRHAVLADSQAARALLEALVGKLGDGAVVRPPLFVDYGEHLCIGAGTYINFNLTALGVAAITIGDDCQIGPNVQLLTPTHPVEAGPRRDKLEPALPITIGDNVWLGGGVIVCPGARIGQNTVVGAGSVVVDDLPADVVAVGAPARGIKTVPPDPGH